MSCGLFWHSECAVGRRDGGLSHMPGGVSRLFSSIVFLDCLFDCFPRLFSSIVYSIVFSIVYSIVFLDYFSRLFSRLFFSIIFLDCFSRLFSRLFSSIIFSIICSRFTINVCLLKHCLFHFFFLWGWQCHHPLWHYSMHSQ